MMRGRIAALRQCDPPSKLLADGCAERHPRTRVARTRARSAGSNGVQGTAAAIGAFRNRARRLWGMPGNTIEYERRPAEGRAGATGEWNETRPPLRLPCCLRPAALRWPHRPWPNMALRHRSPRLRSRCQRVKLHRRRHRPAVISQISPARRARRLSSCRRRSTPRMPPISRPSWQRRKAKAKTKDDRYVIGQLQLRAAVDAKDNAAIVTAIDAVLASGVASARRHSSALHQSWQAAVQRQGI